MKTSGKFWITAFVLSVIIVGGLLGGGYGGGDGYGIGPAGLVTDVVNTLLGRANTWTDVQTFNASVDFATNNVTTVPLGASIQTYADNTVDLYHRPGDADNYACMFCEQ
jgi:hypothetical protein